MTFQSALDDAAGRTQACLAGELDGYADQPVVAAMLYATRGGKGLRGFLAMESAALHGIPAERSVWAAAAVEAVHAYSLVHDDLPAMDDDHFRRGRPTVHVKWDDATAILVGDALQTLAFDLLAREACAPDPAVRVRLIASMAQAAGARGMVLGQAQDMAAETASTALSLAQITDLQANKTGALIRWSAEVGAILAQADPTPLGEYATALGLAFQIADDILDVEGDSDVAGKRLRKDADAGKATFVSLLGLQGAKDRAATLVEQAEDALSGYGARAENLRMAARFVIAREK